MPLKTTAWYINCCRQPRDKRPKDARADPSLFPSRRRLVAISAATLVTMRIARLFPAFEDAYGFNVAPSNCLSTRAWLCGWIRITMRLRFGTLQRARRRHPAYLYESLAVSVLVAAARHPQTGP